MKTQTITENYLKVLRHRIQKSKTPRVEHLKKIASLVPEQVTKSEFKSYVQKAKKSYDELLLCINSTTSKKCEQELSGAHK